jgi:HEAT repeat protein
MDVDDDIEAELELATSHEGPLVTLEQLLEALNDKTSNVRADATYDLGRLGDKRAVEPLIAALRDRSSGVREGAASALGWLGDKRALKPLIRSMQDQSPMVRMSAALALGHLGDERALPVLEWAYEHDKGEYRPGDDVRGCAAYAIARFKKADNAQS